MSKSYWLLKSEPDVWSLYQQKKIGHKGLSAEKKWNKQFNTKKIILLNLINLILIEELKLKRKMLLKTLKV